MRKERFAPSRPLFFYAIISIGKRKKREDHARQKWWCSHSRRVVHHQKNSALPGLPWFLRLLPFLPSLACFNFVSPVMTIGAEDGKLLVCEHKLAMAGTLWVEEKTHVPETRKHNIQLIGMETGMQCFLGPDAGAAYLLSSRELVPSKRIASVPVVGWVETWKKIYNR